MYGCIIGKDSDGIWLLAEGHIEKLKELEPEYKSLSDELKVLTVTIDKEELDDIRDNAVLIAELFSSNFSDGTEGKDI